jgi:Fe-S-cluster containining protein
VIHPQNIRQAANQHKKELRELIKKLKRNDKRLLDDKVHRLHYQIFDSYNCTACANCCRSLGPKLTNKDIARLADYLKITDSAFFQKYVVEDEDGDFVFREMPCVFLQSDNLCAVYDIRPKACREYPHTDKTNFHQILDLSLLNAEICPAVYEIFVILQKNNS